MAGWGLFDLIKQAISRRWPSPPNGRMGPVRPDIATKYQAMAVTTDRA